ncbi:MAG: hypothetical protein IT166_11740 [Bryobacterales bacterium]|nr:hypothetical protein [Bryobacterales bacterium]
MSDWLDNLWWDLTQHTVLFPYELAVLVFFVLLHAIPGFEWPFLTAAVHKFRRFANRRPLAIAAVFLFTLVGHFAAEPGYRTPPPGVHDEFSYLLAADTFASGRLTNPPHPMRFFFESFHILTEPTYMSMYPPGNGMMLASGMLIANNPMAGVWLCAALAAAALCWMLQGWVTPSWALLASLIFAIRVAWLSYWGNSYWGGILSALGGALLLGAVPRLMKRPHWSYALALGSGMVILENTRLYEGTILNLAAAIWLLVWLIRNRRREIALWIAKAGVPLAILLAVAIVWMGYYNWRITGNPLLLPYLLNRQKFEMYGSFVWQDKHPGKHYDHEALRKFYVESEGYRDKEGYLRIQLQKPQRLWFFFIGPALTLAVIGAFGGWRSRRLQLAWISVLSLFAAHLLVPWNILPHYAGPITAPIYLLLIEGVRRLAAFRRHAALPGRLFSRASLATVFFMLFFRIAAPSLGISVYQEFTLPWYSYGLHANFHRANVESKLLSMGGEHLILVRYRPNHLPHQEWVYNKADIDAAPIVWARYVEDQSRLKILLDYYKNRKIWIISPDDNPTRIFEFKEHPQ